MARNFGHLSSHFMFGFTAYILAIWRKLAIAVGQEMLLIIQSFGRSIQLYNKTNEDREEIFG